MTEPYDYGPLRTYELTWKSGHIETVQGHQVIFGSDKAFGDVFAASLLGGGGLSLPSAPAADRPDLRFTIHGEFDGHWRLVLSAPEKELHMLRDVTGRAEEIPGVTS